MRRLTGARTAGGRGGRGSGGLLAVVGLCVVVPIAALLVGSWLAGWRLQQVTTGSMLPAYPPGSLLVSTPIDAADVETGMAVTFTDPRDRGRTVTHRVVEVQNDPDDGLRFVTQGDANPQPDPVEVPGRNIRSRVRWAIPELGGLLALAQSGWGIAALFGIPLLVIGVGELRDRRRPRVDARVFDDACAACQAAIGSDDRYCRICGARQPIHRPEVDARITPRPLPGRGHVTGVPDSRGRGRAMSSVPRD